MNPSDIADMWPGALVMAITFSLLCRDARVRKPNNNFAFIMLALTAVWAWMMTFCGIAVDLGFKL